jgi:ribosome biogenesis GTPase
VTVRGKIIEEQKNYYCADTGTTTVTVTPRGTLRKEKKRLCAGDTVDIEITNTDPPEGIILSVHERTNFLPRPPIANLDQIVYVCTCLQPSLNTEILDRFLFAAHVQQLPIVLLFNKIDLLDNTHFDAMKRIADTYGTLGYPVLFTSACTGEGIETVLASCKGKESVFAGISGVGKTKLLTVIFPDERLRTGELSEQLECGRHTTTGTLLLKLPLGGYIADTPGFSYLDIPKHFVRDVQLQDISIYFPELETRIGQCRFNNCLHENEPGCAVKSAVDTKDISPWRYENYLRILSEIRDTQQHMTAR